MGGVKIIQITAALCRLLSKYTKIRAKNGELLRYYLETYCLLKFNKYLFWTTLLPIYHFSCSFFMNFTSYLCNYFLQACDCCLEVWTSYISLQEEMRNLSFPLLFSSIQDYGTVHLCNITKLCLLLLESADCSINTVHTNYFI